MVVDVYLVVMMIMIRMNSFSRVSLSGLIFSEMIEIHNDEIRHD